MFDMGFTEMMLIGIVALIVIGPERLPGVARTAGKYFGRLKRFMTTVKADVEQELRADELRQILADQQRELDTLKDSISDAGKEIEKEASAVAEAGASVADSVDEPPDHDPLPDLDAVEVPAAEASTRPKVDEAASDVPAAEESARPKSDEVASDVKS